MGVNVRAYLSPGTRAKDVQKVASILLGAQPTMTDIPSVSVEGCNKSETCLTPADAYIRLVLACDPNNPVAKALSDSDGLPYRLEYFFEAGPFGEPYLYPKSTAAKIALVAGLARFFGGCVDYADCDDTDWNLYVQRPDDVHAKDGVLWKSLQDRMFNLKPLTQADIDAVKEWAAYD